jgi:mono/diheme cytochrome c family protein
MRTRIRRLALAIGAAVAILVLGVGLTHGGGATAQRSAATPTWSEVSPIFAEHCVTCHTVGGIAPFSLETAAGAKSHAKAILAATQSGMMPPYPPGADSPAFLGVERRTLTVTEKDTLARWVKGGAPIETGARTGARPTTGQQAAPGRLVTLAPEESYLPRATGGATDDYHCFLLDPGLDRNAFVTSATIQPEHADIVHHVILFEAAGGAAQQARQLNASNDGHGWTCFGGSGVNDTSTGVNSDRLGAPQWIAGWAPGAAGGNLPDGTGVLLHAGALVIMQVHYNLLHKAVPDQSKVALRLVDAAGSSLTPLDTLLYPAPVELPCARGAKGALCNRNTALADEQRKYGTRAAFVPTGLLLLCGKSLADYPQSPASVTALKTSCDRRVSRPLRIYSVGGHMHLRGTDIKVQLVHNGVAQTLLHIPHWDFHWQGAYFLAKPIDADPGDVIRVSCRYNNAPTNQPMVGMKRLAQRYVLWGEGTTDEMCLGIIQAATRG